MRTTVILITIILASIVSPSLAGALNIRTIKDKPSAGPPVDRARTLLQTHRTALGWDRVVLSASRVVTSPAGEVVTFEQTYEGLRLVGRTVKVELDHTGRPARVFGNPLTALDMQIPTLINPAQAIMAIEDMEDRVLPLDLGGETVLLTHGKSPVVAYLFSIASGYQLHRYFVDATTGKVLIKQRGYFNAQAKVFLIDPALTPDATQVELHNLTADATYLDGYDGQFKVWQCVTAPSAGAYMGDTPDVENATLVSIPTSDASGNYIYEPVLGVDYTELAGAVNLFYHVDRMYSHFMGLGYEAPLDMDIIANLHSETNGTKTPYDNAFFTPSSDLSRDIITAGQGTDIDLAYGGDVIMHEFTHSVIYHAAIGLDSQQFDQYGIHRMPLAIHEGLADYFPSSLNESPVMGAWALEQLEAGASRNLETNPKVCPDDMLGEEHYDGEVLSSAAWAMRQALGGRENADPIIYATLLRLDSNSTFKDFHESLVLSLDDAFAAGDITQTQYDDVLAISRSKGLDICGRYLPLDAEGSTSTAFGLNMLAAAMGGSCSQFRQLLGGYGSSMPTLFQYAVTVPEGTTSLTLTVTFNPLEVSTDFLYNVYGRGGQMVQYDLVSIYGGFQVPVPSDFDTDFGGAAFTGLTQELVWTVNDETPLPTGQDVYFAIAHQNCPSATMELSVTLSDEPIENPDAGTDAQDDADVDSGITDPPKSSEDGCKCSSVGAARTAHLPAAVFLFLALFAFVLRRRLAQ